MAPVKAPRLLPKSMVSNRVSGMAAQFTAMYGLSRRELWLWMDWATNSLPVPVWP